MASSTDIISKYANDILDHIATIDSNVKGKIISIEDMPKEDDGSGLETEMLLEVSNIRNSELEEINNDLGKFENELYDIYEKIESPYDIGIDINIFEGVIEIVVAFYSSGSVETDADLASELGRIGVLKSLKSRGILPTQRGASLAAERGHIGVLKLLNSWDIRPEAWGANLAAESGHIGVLKLLKSWASDDQRSSQPGDLKEITKGILPTEKAADGAAKMKISKFSNY